VIEGALIDGMFPDYERVIPRGEPQYGAATVAREPFMRAVAAVTAFAKASGVKWRAAPILRFVRGTNKRGEPLVLGNADLAKFNRAAALDRAETLRPLFAETAGMSAHKAADMLNIRQVATPTGRPWSAKTVIRVRARLGFTR
jgi:hypothetical protein